MSSYDTELKTQAILNRAFDTNLLNTTSVGSASNSTNDDVELKPQEIWNRVFDEDTNTIRTVNI